MKRILAGIVLAVGLSTGTAYADSINFSDPVVTPSGSNFLWRYAVTIDNLEEINTALNPSFATLYDLNGLVPGSAAYTNNVATLTDVVSQQNVGITPATQNPTDNPAVPNVTVTYTGTAPSSTVLGVLSFLDVNSGASEAIGNFSAQATNLADRTVEANTSSVPVPTPEPSTLALLAGGVLGMIGVVRRRFR